MADQPIASRSDIASAAPDHGQKPHDCPRCRAKTLHAYRYPRSARTALHMVKLLGSLCTLGMAFPHEFANPESPARCTRCSTTASIPAF